MKRILTALMVAFTLLVPSGGVSFAQDYQKGLEAVQEGDYETALREWSVLAEKGNEGAQFNLGQMYDKGLGVTQDYKEAVRWYRKSAAQGNVIAQFNLGVMYMNGQGVTQDYKEAVRWYRKSAEQHYSQSQLNLGLMYAKGLGVTQSDIYAHMWFNIAASNGDAMAAKGMDIAAKKMTASQLEEAQELARECVRKNYKGC